MQVRNLPATLIKASREKSISHNYKTEQDHKFHSGAKGSLKSVGLGGEKGGSGDDNESLFLSWLCERRANMMCFCD